jgi:hypothetical protein
MNKFYGLTELAREPLQTVTKTCTNVKVIGFVV